jgi:transposase
VPEGRDEVSVRVFQTFTVDLHALVDWLEACGVETVAMESTGVYWIPVYELLEERGFEVYLVNARHVSNVDGKKTDLLDCQSPKGRRSALDPTTAHLRFVASLLPARGRNG